MNKSREYIKNTIILLIGKFSTQIIAFLLIPLYTYKLSTSNYGYIDLIQTYISLFAPVLLLQLDSAVFRHIIDVRKNEEEKSKIISSSFIFILLLIFISLIIFLLINIFIKVQYYPYIVLNMLATVLNNYGMSIARGNGHNKNYAIASIISSILTVSINLILILIFNFDARSILIASIISNALSFIYIFNIENIWKQISIKKYEKKTLKKLLNYSIPMIPNVLSWWVVGLSDRTIIVHFIGTAANGIYSISCKFSNLLNSIFSIFNMSWQETASLHINDEDASDFFSKMIMNIFDIFVVISCLIIGILPIVFNIVIGAEYIESYNYIPILLLANLCNVLVGLFGGIYVSKKMTKKVANTTIISAIINIIINLSFVRMIGLYAACISTLISYLVMIIYRYYDINKIIKLKLFNKKSIIYLVVFFELIIMYYVKQVIISIILTIFILIIYVLFNKKNILNYINEILLNLKKKC